MLLSFVNTKLWVINESIPDKAISLISFNSTFLRLLSAVNASNPSRCLCLRLTELIKKIIALEYAKLFATWPQHDSNTFSTLLNRCHQAAVMTTWNLGHRKRTCFFFNCTRTSLKNGHIYRKTWEVVRTVAPLLWYETDIIELHPRLMQQKTSVEYAVP